MALVLGLLFGVLLSKLFAMLLLRLIAVAVPTPLLFSWSAVGQTVTMFSLIFVGLALLDASVIYRYRLPELFHQPVLHVGEQLNYRHYFWGGCGGLLLIYAYWSAQNYAQAVRQYHFFGVAAFLILPLLILVAVLLGTFLFYRASLALILQYLRRRKSFSYQGLRLLTLADLNQRLRQNVNISWLVTILTAITLTVLGSITMVYAGAQSILNDAQPVALTVDRQLSSVVKKELSQAQIPIRRTQTATLKIIATRFKIHSAIGLNYGANRGPVSVISQTDYQAMRQIQSNLPAINLGDQQAILLLRKVGYAGQAADQSGFTVYLNTPQVKALKVQQILNAFPYGSSNYVDETGLVVSDHTFQRLQADIQTHPVAFDFAHTKQSERVSNQIMQRYGERNYQIQSTKVRPKFSELHFHLVQPQQITNETYAITWTNARYPQVRGLRTLFGLDTYISGFVSLIFIMATGSIIMLKQLATAAENREQYVLLTKLGVSLKAIRRSIYVQTGMTFLLPIILGMINAYFALHILNVWLNQLDLTFAYLIGLFYLLVYSIYCWLTARVYYRLIRPK